MIHRWWSVQWNSLWLCYCGTVYCLGAVRAIRTTHYEAVLLIYFRFFVMMEKIQTHLLASALTTGLFCVLIVCF